MKGEQKRPGVKIPVIYKGDRIGYVVHWPHMMHAYSGHWASGARYCGTHKLEDARRMLIDAHAEKLAGAACKAAGAVFYSRGSSGKLMVIWTHAGEWSGREFEGHQAARVDFLKTRGIKWN